MLYCFMCIIMQLMSLDNSTTPLILNVANNNYNLYMYIHLYILQIMYMLFFHNTQTEHTNTKYKKARKGIRCLTQKLISYKLSYPYRIDLIWYKNGKLTQRQRLQLFHCRQNKIPEFSLRSPSSSINKEKKKKI